MVHSLDRYLQTYSLEEILEMNDLTDEEVLEILIDQEYIQLPVKPVDV